MKMRNLVKEKLAANGYVLGAFAASGSVMNCECLGINGMDFVIIDAEHAQTSTESMVHMSCASELYGMAAFVRVCNPCDTAAMARLLDVGIHGLMIPMVRRGSRRRRSSVPRSIRLWGCGEPTAAAVPAGGHMRTILSRPTKTSIRLCSVNPGWGWSTLRKFARCLVWTVFLSERQTCLKIWGTPVMWQTRR